jgi:FG-GAP-like repeat
MDCLARKSIAFVVLLVAAIAPGRMLAANPTPAEDTPDEPSALVVTSDFNRDGITDIARTSAPNGDSAPSILTVMLGQPDGTFRPAATTPVVGIDPKSIAVGDFNRDGNPDLIVGDADGSLIILLGDGKGNLVPTPKGIRLASVASIATGDFNHDGILDMVVSDPHSNTATILLGSGDGSFHPAWSFKLPMQGNVYHLAVADFNGDGIPDIVVTNEDQDSFEVLLGNGNGTFTSDPALSHLIDPNAHCAT